MVWNDHYQPRQNRVTYGIAKKEEEETSEAVDKGPMDNPVIDKSPMDETQQKSQDWVVMKYANISIYIYIYNTGIE